MLHEAGDYRGAAEQYTKALRLDPGNAHAIYNLGNVFRDEGRLPMAVAHYRQHLNLTGSDGTISAVLSLLDRRSALLAVRLLQDRTIAANVERLVLGGYLDAVNNMVKLAEESSPGSIGHPALQALQDLRSMAPCAEAPVAASSSSAAAAAALQTTARMSREVHLIVQYYRAASSSRQREIDLCLGRNLDNPLDHHCPRAHGGRV